MVVHANRLATRTALPPRVGFVVSKAVGNAVVLPTGPDGTITVYSSASTYLTVDVQGWIRS